MANDGSIMVIVEQWIADTLAALKKPDETKVFKKAEPWDYQIDPTKGGIEAFVKYAPFAFVSFMPSDPNREGDYDLNEQLVFAVALGTVSIECGVARKGDENHYGISKLYDLTLGALDKQAPPNGISGDLAYIGWHKVAETERSYCLQLYFESSLIRTPQ